MHLAISLLGRKRFLQNAINITDGPGLEQKLGHRSTKEVVATVFSVCCSVSWEEADHAWKKYMHEQKQAVEIQAAIGEAMNGQVGKKPTEKVQERDDQSVKKCCTKYLIIVVLVIAVLVQACLLRLK